MFTFASLVVVGHLKASSSESALDVEAFVGVAAVEDALVTANLLGDVVEGLDQAEAELLALLILGDGNVLDVADLAQTVDAVGEKKSRLAAGVLNARSQKPQGGISIGIRGLSNTRSSPRILSLSDLQFVLDNQGAGSHNGVLLSRRVLDDDDVIAVRRQHVIELLLELFLADFADRGQHAEAVEEARVVIGATKGSQLVALWQGGGDNLGDEVLGEETILIGVGDGDGRDCGGGRHCEIGLGFFSWILTSERTSERAIERASEKKRRGQGAKLLSILESWPCGFVLASDKERGGFS